MDETNMDSYDTLIQLFRSLGLPGGLLVITAYTIRKVIMWAMPHAENMISAYIKRQETMEECQRKLTDSTVEIQRENRELLKSLQTNLGSFCKGGSNRPTGL